MALVDRITEEYLQRMTGEHEQPQSFTKEAIEHLKFYLSPILTQLENIDDDNFKRIVHTYPREIRTDVEEYIITHNRQVTPRVIMDALISIIYNETNIFDEVNPVDPWDVEQELRSVPALRELFYLPGLAGGVTLNITANINGRNYLFPMSRNLVYGILAYYQQFGREHPLSFYGNYFNREHRIIENFKNDPPLAGYTVEVGNDTYTFYDKEFMRGLLTAHQWVSNEDPHKYITNLKQYKLVNGDTVVTDLTY